MAITKIADELHKLCESQLRPPATSLRKLHKQSSPLLKDPNSFVFGIFPLSLVIQEIRMTSVVGAEGWRDGRRVGLGMAISLYSRTCLMFAMDAEGREHLEMVSKAFVHQLNNASPRGRLVVALAQHLANYEPARRYLGLASSVYHRCTPSSISSSSSCSSICSLNLLANSSSPRLPPPPIPWRVSTDT